MTGYVKCYAPLARHNPWLDDNKNKLNYQTENFFPTFPDTVTVGQKVQNADDRTRANMCKLNENLRASIRVN